MAPVTRTAELRAAFHDALGRAVVGQQQTLDGLLLTILVGGHALLEGVPGTAKTLMARAAAAAVDARFTRLQFTPDLLPSDVTGVNVFDQRTKATQFGKTNTNYQVLVAGVLDGLFE